MNPELQQIFDSTPEEEPRSRLEPYRPLILRWRRQGRSYCRIRELLAEKCNLEISYLALYEFVQRRDRPRKVQPELEPQTALPPEPVAAAIPNTEQAPAERKRLSPEESRPSGIYSVSSQKARGCSRGAPSALRIRPG